MEKKKMLGVENSNDGDEVSKIILEADDDDCGVSKEQVQKNINISHDAEDGCNLHNNENDDLLDKTDSNLKKVCHDDDDDDTKVVEMAKRKAHEMGYEKFESRMVRAVLSLLIPFGLFPLAASETFNTPIISLCGIGLIIMFIIYFVHLFWIVIDAYLDEKMTLYRIYTLSKIVENWTKMSITHDPIKFEKHPIESISEFSAIDGGSAQSMLLTIACYSWSVVTCCMAYEIQDKGFSKIDFGDCSEISGCFGLLLIGIFDLDPFRPWMRRLHYTGALLGSGTMVGFIHQQYHIGSILGLIVSLILTLIAVICFCLWQYYGFVADEFPQSIQIDKNKNNITEKIRKWCIKNNNQLDFSDKAISKVSLKNLVCEAIFLICGALSMCLWMIFYDVEHNELDY